MVKVGNRSEISLSLNLVVVSVEGEGESEDRGARRRQWGREGGIDATKGEGEVSIVEHKK